MGINSLCPTWIIDPARKPWWLAKVDGKDRAEVEVSCSDSYSKSSILSRTPTSGCGESESQPMRAGTSKVLEPLDLM